MIVLTTLVGAGVGYALARTTPWVYRSTVTLLINQQQNPVALDYSQVQVSESLARTYSELIRTRPIIEQAIQTANVTISPEQLIAAVSARSTPNTPLLAVDVENSDPVVASELANALADVLVARGRDESFKQTSSIDAQLRKQISDVSAKLATTTAATDRARASADDRSNELASLQAELLQLQLSYANLIRAQQDLLFAQTRLADAIRIAAPAVPAAAPVRPRLSLNVLVGAAIGLMVGIGFALGRHYLADPVETPEGVERRVQLPTLGTVRRIPEEEIAGLISASAASRDAALEPFRRLYLSLRLALEEGNGRIVLVTSPGPDEGKSTVVAGLACAAAEAGQRVVALDGDLRQPALHDLLGVPRSPGLVHALSSDDPEPSAVLARAQNGDRNLRVLPAGPVTPNPVALLASRTMAELLRRISTEADLILIDGPPVGVVSDSLILARHVDGVVLVAAAGRTSGRDLIQTRASLSQGSPRLLGVVLNHPSGRPKREVVPRRPALASGQSPKPSPGGAAADLGRIDG
jgi:polysaccharide biosynthesis transport protein